MGSCLKVFPTKLKAENVLQESFTTTGSRLFLNNEIVDVSRFEKSLIREFVPFEPIGEIERLLLIHDAISAEKSFGKKGFLTGLVFSDGFIRSVSELFQQLKLGFVTSKELAKISGFSPQKEIWIKSIFKRYETACKRANLKDEADTKIEMIEKLKLQKEPPKSLARFEEIHFYDIYNYNPFRFELIYRLGRLNGRQKIALHFPLPDERRKAFDFIEREINKFQSLEGGEGNIEIMYDQPVKETANTVSLFSNSLFSETQTLLKNDDKSIEINRNLSRYREIEEVVVKIRNLHNKTDLSKFCLVFRDTQTYDLIVEDVFRRANIPVFIQRGFPIRNNPQIKTLLGIFKAIESGFERDEIVKLAVSDYFSFLPKGVTGEEFEELLIKAGIIYGSPQEWKKKIDYLMKDTGYNSPKIKTVFKKLAKLLSLLERLSKSKRENETVTAFKKISAFLSPKPLNLSDPFSTRDLYARQKLEEIFKVMEKVQKRKRFASVSFDWLDLRRLITTSLDNMPSPKWSGQNHIHVLNIHELAGLKFDYLFLCGLHDGEFPRKSRHGSILDESEKREFNKKQGEALLLEESHLKKGRQVFSRIGEAWEEESFLFYLATKSVDKKLFLSYSSHELNGNELARSPFLLETKSLFKNLDEKKSSAVALEKEYADQLDRPAKEAKLLRDIFYKSEEEAGTLRDSFNHYANLKESGLQFRLSLEKISIEMDRVNFYREYDRAKRKTASTSFSGNIGSFAQVTNHFDKTNGNGFSPTALERYATCPFKYFMDKPLACQTLPEPKPDMERTQKGTMVHEIMERYYEESEKRMDKPQLLLLEKRKNKINKIARRVFEERQEKGIKSNPALWEITKKRVLTELSLYIEFEEKQYKTNPPVALFRELSFGVNSGNPVSISINGKTINFRGIIDRVDYFPKSQSYEVVDYKYSANLATHKKLLKHENFGTDSFQMPIYMVAFDALLKGRPELPQEKSISSRYISLRKGIDTAHSATFKNGLAGIDSAVTENCESSFSDRLNELLDNMQSGDFSVTPKNCKFCDYKMVCRYIETKESNIDG